MLKIAICDDSRTDIEMLESAFDKLCQYPIEYDVYFSGEELLTYCTLHDETYHLVLCQYFGHKKSNFFMLHF